VNVLELVVVALAALAAGFVNAVAGGGTLLSFPALTAVGVPIVSASVTSTVALSPGYLGGALAQGAALRRQWGRVRVLAPVCVLGGLTGGVLLLVTSDEVLDQLIPFLILAACALLAGQDRVRAIVERRRARAGHRTPDHGIGPGALAVLFAAAVYGGYFGGGLGIVLLAVLGTVLPDDLREVNALKQTMAFAVNLTAAAFFLFSGRVWWGAAAVMAVAALGGGHLGGRLAGRLDPAVLRRVVVAVGVVVAVVYVVR
jgi:uncharacterized membrane protein YfcA